MNTRTIIATATVILLLGSWWSIAQEEPQVPTDGQWELVVIPDGIKDTNMNYARLHASPIISAILYNRDEGAEGEIYALEVTATCTGTTESRGVTYCTGYEWVTSTAKFSF